MSDLTIATEAISAGLSRTHTRLLQRLVAAEPHTGYVDQSQIGPLTNAELAAILESDENVLADAGTSRALNTTLVNILAQSSYTTIERAALIGAALLGVLTTQCRRTLLTAVQEELARDAENQRADEADERGNAHLSVAVRRSFT